VSSRAHFLSAIFALGARPGPYCLPLRKGAADKLYDFELEILDDTKIFSLADNIGHPVWLNFYASWCPPCNREMPDVVGIAAKYAASGLRVFGMDVNEADDKARDFVKKYAIPFPVLLRVQVVRLSIRSDARVLRRERSPHVRRNGPPRTRPDG
jgi:thiol-disulfide isomerase/thioredoxin